MKNILVVDNNTVMLQYMQEILSAEGYGVVTVADGLSALEVLREYRPDFIFVDLVMPGIDGKRLCKVIRSRDELKDSRIIIISAVATEEPDLAFSDYAEVYIAKMPFKKMRPLIIDVLDKLQNGSEDIYIHRILGVEEVHTREITKEFLYNKKHLDTILANLPDGMLEITFDYKIIYANSAAAELAEQSDAKLLSTSFLDLFNGTDRSQDGQIRDKIKEVLITAKKEQIDIGEREKIFIGSKRVFIRFIPIRFEENYSIIVILRNISVQKKAENIISDALEEKDTLIKKIHHRIKNNFQVIASLLNLQAQQIDEKETVHYFLESQNRIAAIALIYENMYQSENDEAIELKAYVSDLTSQLIRGCSDSSRTVRASVLGEEIRTPLEKAISLGLILNELLVHAVEDSGHNGDEMAIRIELDRDEAQSQCSVTFKIEGEGFPLQFRLMPAESFGHTLVSILIQQLEGKIAFPGDDQRTARITFNL